MKTLSIQNGDLYLDEKGNLASVTDLEALRQTVHEYLATIKGEWVLDFRFGVPYHESVFGIGRTSIEAEAIFSNAILGFSQITSIISSGSDIDHGRRKFIYLANVDTVYGKTEILING